MLFSDESTYSNFGFRHNPEEETAADTKAMELLKNSPYAQKLDVPSLFLKELTERAPTLSALLTAHLGNSFTNDKGQLIRLSALATTRPGARCKQTGSDRGTSHGWTREAERLDGPRGTH